MGKIGFGYGSEYQLMRFLGRHRNMFDNQVKKAIGIDGDIHWMDFKYSGLLDSEIMNVDFIADLEVKKKWNKLWATNNNKSGINWDAVGMIGDTYILVEAKAHKKEIYQPMSAKDSSSIEKIISAFKNLSAKYNIDFNDNWLTKHYQLMNHLVAIDFLNDQGIEAILLNTYFINGYEVDALGNPINDKKSVLSEEEWESIILKEYRDLGIENSHIKEHIFNLFIKC